MPKSDQLPMMEHEAGLAREFSDEKHEGTVFVKQYERQSSLKLAIVTMLVFVSAIAFLMLFLVTPIFYSLSHPAQHDTSNNSHGSMVMPHDESMPHEHHGEDDDRKRRSADDHLAVAFRDRIKVRILLLAAVLTLLNYCCLYFLQMTFMRCGPVSCLIHFRVTLLHRD